MKVTAAGHKPTRLKTLLAALMATGALAAGAQALAPATALAVDDENTNGTCHPGFGFMPPGKGLDDNGNICSLEGSGGDSGGGSSDGDSSGGGSSDGGTGSGGGFHTGDLCADYGLCDDPVKDKPWEPKDGWDALDEEEADQADEALGKKPLSGGQPPQRPGGGRPRDPCEGSLRRFIAAPEGDEEDRALQEWRRCVLEHRNDRTITARLDHGHRKKSARRHAARSKDRA